MNFPSTLSSSYLHQLLSNGNINSEGDLKRFLIPSKKKRTEYSSKHLSDFFSYACNDRTWLGDHQNFIDNMINRAARIIRNKEVNLSYRKALLNDVARVYSKVLTTFNEPEYVNFKLTDKNIQVNFALLCLQSKYFSTMLGHQGYKENRLYETRASIEVQEDHEKTFNDLINLVNDSQINFDPVLNYDQKLEQIKQLIDDANQYLLMDSPYVAPKIEKALKSLLRVEYAVDFYLLSVEYCMDELRRRCCKIIKDEIENNSENPFEVDKEHALGICETLQSLQLEHGANIDDFLQNNKLSSYLANKAFTLILEQFVKEFQKDPKKGKRELQQKFQQLLTKLPSAVPLTELDFSDLSKFNNKEFSNEEFNGLVSLLPTANVKTIKFSTPPIAVLSHISKFDKTTSLLLINCSKLVAIGWITKLLDLEDLTIENCPQLKNLQPIIELVNKDKSKFKKLIYNPKFRQISNTISEDLKKTLKDLENKEVKVESPLLLPPP